MAKGTDMGEELDHLMEAMRRQPQARLDGLEGRVWARIDGLRRTGRAMPLLTPLRAASVMAALGLGMLGGSLVSQPSARGAVEVSAFSVDAHLAPSTLLDGR
ncbi:hypothetical protein AS593_13340 [Caulobacter vibrioides]|nr:hypothetical protein AS593_13340 [Caulobacter vibrioides]